MPDRSSGYSLADDASEAVSFARPQARLRSATRLGSGGYVPAWSFVAVLGVIDSVWSARMGMAFHGWAPALVCLGILAAIALFYTVTGREERLAAVAHFALLWVAFSLVGAIFTYLTASLNLPLRDAEFHRLDGMLGFNWMAWFDFVHSHRGLRIPLAMAYASFLPQILISIVYLAHVRRSDRNAELLLTSMVALLITGIIAGLLPAVSPYPYLTANSTNYLEQFRMAHGAAASTFVLARMDGIVTFPSYHTIIAVLLVYAHRPPLRSFRLVAVVNALMLMSLPSEGSHYLVDVIAGIAVAGLSIAMIRALGALRTPALAQEPASDLTASR